MTSQMFVFIMIGLLIVAIVAVLARLQTAQDEKLIQRNLEYRQSDSLFHAAHPKALHAKGERCPFGRIEK